MKEAVRELPKYLCHKTVSALQIKEIKGESDGWYLVPVEHGYAPVKVSQEYMTKHEPQVGGYYVVYEGGYKSFSPADAFENGYTLITKSMRGEYR